MSDPNQDAPDARTSGRGSLVRVVGLSLLFGALLAAIWSLFGPSPFQRWVYLGFLLPILMQGLKFLANRPWSRLKAGATVVEVLQDPRTEPRPRLEAAADALAAAILVAFVIRFCLWLLGEQAWMRLAAVAPLAIICGAVTIMRLWTVFRPVRT